MAVWFKNGKWHAEFRDEHRRKHHKVFQKKTDAVDWEQENRVAVRRGSYMAPSRETIGEMADLWLKRKTDLGLGFHALQNWRIHIDKYIKPELGELEIQRATVKHIEDAALVWKERCSAHQANMVLKTLTSIVDLALRRGIIEANLAEKAELFNLDNLESSEN